MSPAWTIYNVNIPEAKARGAFRACASTHPSTVARCFSPSLSRGLPALYSGARACEEPVESEDSRAIGPPEENGEGRLVGREFALYIPRSPLTACSLLYAPNDYLHLTRKRGELRRIACNYKRFSAKQTAGVELNVRPRTRSEFTILLLLLLPLRALTLASQDIYNESPLPPHQYPEI